MQFSVLTSSLCVAQPWKQVLVLPLVSRCLCNHINFATSFGDASGNKAFESARCCKTWLTVVRRHFEDIVPDASPKKCNTTIDFVLI